MRSSRRFSCTSICDQAFSTWLRERTSPLYASDHHPHQDHHDDDHDDDGEHGDQCTGPSVGQPAMARPGHQRAVDLDVAVGQRGHREVVRTLHAGVAEPIGERSIAEDRTQRVGERCRIARLDEERIDAVGRHVPVPVERTGHDRRARRHRLDQHHPERFAVQRRRTEHVRRSQPGELLVVGDPTEPLESGVARPSSRSVPRCRGRRCRSTPVPAANAAAPPRRAPADLCVPRDVRRRRRSDRRRRGRATARPSGSRRARHR